MGESRKRIKAQEIIENGNKMEIIEGLGLTQDTSMMSLLIG